MTLIWIGAGYLALTIIVMAHQLWLAKQRPSVGAFFLAMITWPFWLIGLALAHIDAWGDEQ